jgi:pilus assembly protein CpaE
MTSVVVATPDASFASRVRTVLERTMETSVGEIVHVGDVFAGNSPWGTVEALVSPGTGPPDVIALGPGVATLDLLEVARQIDEIHPEINVVLVTPVTEGLLERALRAGVRDVIGPHASDTEIGLAFQRALESAVRRRTVFNGGAPSEPDDRRIITVISPKGGSGKTTLATNLAVGLARHERGKVLLVDLDLTFGDVGSALRLVPEHTMGDLVGSEGGLDPLAMKVLLTPHDESGLYVLCAPETPVQGEQVTVTHSDEVLRFAGSEFSHVIVDTSAGLSDHTLCALERSTDILMLCTMDVPSVRSLRKVVDALEALGMTKQRRHFVLNRAHTKVGLATEDIERTVGMPVDVCVDSSREVPLSMNEGIPLVAGDLRSPVARQLAEVVSRFTDQPVGARRGLFERWRAS